MSRLLTLGFESGNDPLLAELADGGSSGTAPTIQSSVVHAGSWAMEKPQGTGNRAFRVFLRNNGGTFLAEGAHVYFRTYFRLEAAPATGETLVFLRGGGSANALQSTVAVLDDRTVRLTNHVVNVSKTTTFQLTLNAWYRIEYHCHIHNVSGEIELRIYADADVTPTLHATLTLNASDGAGDTLAGTLMTELGFGQLETPPTSRPRCWFDDIAVNNGEGTTHNTWPGAGRIASVRPAANHAVAWDRGGTAPAAQNWDSVDEAHPNDGVDFNEVSTINALDLFTLATLPAAIPTDAVIKAVDVYARVGGTQVSAVTMALEVLDHNNQPIAGNAVSTALNGWKGVNSGGTRGNLVVTGTVTKTQLQAFKIGYRATGDQTQVRRASAVWLNVEWAQSGTPTTTVTPAPITMELVSVAPLVLLDNQAQTTVITPSPVEVLLLLVTPSVGRVGVTPHPGAPRLARVNLRKHGLEVVAAGSEVYIEVEIRDVTKADAPLMTPQKVLFTLLDPCDRVVFLDTPMAVVSTGRFNIRHQTRTTDEPGIWLAQFKTTNAARVNVSPFYAVFKLT